MLQVLKAFFLEALLPSVPQVNSKSMIVVLCVCVLSLSVLATATVSLHALQTSDLLSCCKKLSPLNRHPLPF